MANRTRYFGGRKLGTGGLVKAYSGAVQRALDSLSMSRADRRYFRSKPGHSDANATLQAGAS